MIGMKKGMWLGLVALIALVAISGSAAAATAYKPVSFSGFAGSKFSASPYVQLGTIPSGMSLTSSAGASLFGSSPSVSYGTSLFGMNGAGVIGEISTFGKANFINERQQVTYSDSTSAKGTIYVFQKSYQF